MGAFTASDDTKGTAEPSGWSRSPWTLAILAVLVVAALPVGAHASVPRHLVPSPDAAAAFAEARAPARAPSLAPIELADDTYEIVVTKDGATHAGRLVQMDNGVIVLQTADGHTDRIPMAQVASVHLQAAPPAPPPAPEPSAAPATRAGKPEPAATPSSAAGRRLGALRDQLNGAEAAEVKAHKSLTTDQVLMAIGGITLALGLPGVLLFTSTDPVFIAGAILAASGGLDLIIGLLAAAVDGPAEGAAADRVRSLKAQIASLASAPEARRVPVVPMVAVARF